MQSSGLRPVVGIAVGALALALAGCSFSTTPVVAKSDLQQDISERLEKAGQKPQSVTCKDNLTGEVGKTVPCEVVITDDNSIEPIVKVTKVEGTTVSYEMTPAVTKEQLAKSVSKIVSATSGEKVDSVTCESGLEGKKGSEAKCDVTAGGVTVRRTVDVTEVDGLLISFTVVPSMSKQNVENTLLDKLAEQLGQRPDSADCSGPLDGKPGNTIDCKVVAGDETQDFTLTVKSATDDRINFSFAPKN
ncbi:MAG: DUF4333 domain-containing protein [Mycobacterium sp.]